MKKFTAFLLRHEYLIWILSACALLRLPSLLEPYWYGDEGIYLVLGNAIRHGLTLYRDIHDNKPPLIYFMAAITGSVFWFRFFLLAWNSIAIIAFERLSHLLLDTKSSPGVTKILGIEFPKVSYSTVATALFAVLPFFAEGAIANGEIFMIMPVIVAIFLLWRRKSDEPWKVNQLVWAGVFFSVAFLIKVPALFDAFAAGFFFFVILPLGTWRVQKSGFSIAPYIRPIVLFTVAFLIPVLMSLAYYGLRGAGPQYVKAAFAQNIGYLSSWSTGSHAAANVGSSGLKNRAIIFGVALVVLTVLSKKSGKKMTFLAIWFTAALFGALLAERPYPHYLIQVIPPAVLMLMYSLRSVKEKSIKIYSMPTILSCTALIVFVLSVRMIHFWYYPLVQYYKNYISFVSGKISRDTYFAHFDKNLPAMYELSSFVASTTKNEDRIFVWGDHPMVYALSRRLPPGRYTSSYHINDFNGYDETTRALESTRPKYIVIDTAYSAPYGGLAAYMSGQYVHMSDFGRFALYRKLGR